jgi:hypothetical protein
MKKFLTCLLALTFSYSFVGPVNASVSGAVKKYANCTALNKDFPGGVAKSSKVKNKGGKTKKSPKVSAALYNANIKMDRDKDGIACEK